MYAIWCLPAWQLALKERIPLPNDHLICISMYLCPYHMIHINNIRRICLIISRLESRHSFARSSCRSSCIRCRSTTTTTGNRTVYFKLKRKYHHKKTNRRHTLPRIPLFPSLLYQNRLYPILPLTEVKRIRVKPNWDCASPWNCIGSDLLKEQSLYENVTHKSRFPFTVSTALDTKTIERRRRRSVGKFMRSELNDLTLPNSFIPTHSSWKYEREWGIERQL